jgi:hypothetical protein
MIWETLKTNKTVFVLVEIGEQLFQPKANWGTSLPQNVKNVAILVKKRIS